MSQSDVEKFFRELQATPEAVATTLQELEVYLEASSLPQRLCFVAQLAAEELLTNVAKYGGDAPRTTLEFNPADPPVMRLSDDGRPFNPLEVPPPQFDVPPAEREVGGLGLHLVRELAGDLEYHYTDGRNVICVRFPPLAQVDQPTD